MGTIQYSRDWCELGLVGITLADVIWFWRAVMCACARKSCSRSWSIADVSTVVGVRTRFSVGGTVVPRTLVVVVLVLSPDSVTISRSGLAGVCGALDTSFDPSMSLDMIGEGKGNTSC